MLPLNQCPTGRRCQIRRRRRRRRRRSRCRAAEPVVRVALISMRVRHELPLEIPIVVYATPWGDDGGGGGGGGSGGGGGGGGGRDKIIDVDAWSGPLTNV